MLSPNRPVTLLSLLHTCEWLHFGISSSVSQCQYATALMYEQQQKNNQAWSFLAESHICRLLFGKSYHHEEEVENKNCFRQDTLILTSFILEHNNSTFKKCSQNKEDIFPY